MERTQLGPIAGEAPFDELKWAHLRNDRGPSAGDECVKKLLRGQHMWKIYIYFFSVRIT
jgi:hypothetical protein